MGTGVSMVGRGGGGQKNNILYVSECPEKIGGNAFGLRDAMLPLGCQLAKK